MAAIWPCYYYYNSNTGGVNKCVIISMESQWAAVGDRDKPVLYAICYWKTLTLTLTLLLACLTLTLLLAWNHNGRPSVIGTNQNCMLYATRKP